MTDWKLTVKKLAIAALLGLGVLTATTGPAAASGYVYTGYWYSSYAACEQAWTNSHGGPGGTSLPHQCKYNSVGVYELWAYQL
ncbi:hypothetical protein [Streptomyces canus]|uniref:hypothetical protein n=1 Tax=Streptomyces canus TaxID=58343 RepID=UPI00037A751C|nr:hypothetical protein [Streptomyces canus]